ncbi:MAG: CRISPR-associated endoribonuclease Cas6 [Bacillota bacterium]
MAEVQPLRVRLVLEGPAGVLHVPVHYNEVIQGLIYRYLDPDLAGHIHDGGYPEGPRRFKLFTFSRLLGRWERAGDRLRFRGPVSLVVASPVPGFVASLVSRFLSVGTLQVADQPTRLLAVETEAVPQPSGPVRVKLLSPLTVYTTLQTNQGRYTYYFSPFEEGFAAQVLRNLERKLHALTGNSQPLGGAFRPVRVSDRNLHIVRYKGTVIKGWTGIYELDVPPEAFRLAYLAGLGSKNSQGFGCIALWERSGPGD